MSRYLAIVTVLITVAVMAQQSTAPPATPSDDKGSDSAVASSQMLLKLEQFKTSTRGNSYVIDWDPNYPEGRSLSDSSMTIERSTVLIGQDSSVAWTIDVLEDNHTGDAHNGYKCKTVRSYNTVLRTEQIQQLKSIIDSTTFTRLDRRKLNVERFASGSTHGALFIWRGDHIQALGFGSGNRSKADKRAADAKEQEKIDSDIQNVLRWIEGQIQKPHKKQLGEHYDKCTPSY